MATFKGQLEINERGVIYFHENKTGASLLRIQGLLVPIPTPKAGEGLDIRVIEAHVNWRGESSRPKEQDKQRQHACHNASCLTHGSHVCHDLRCFQP